MSVPRVYALGNAPILPLLCHEIASLSIQPKVPEVVLLLQDQKKLGRFLNNDSKLTIQTEYNSDQKYQQFMASCSPPVYATGELVRMKNLIVGECRPKSFTMSLQKYAQSIDSDTNILLLNPTFGLIDFLYRNLWVYEKDRPNVFIGEGCTDQGILSAREFTLKFTGYKEPFNISSVPRSLDEYDHEVELQRVAQFERENEMLRLLNMINKEETLCALNVVNYPYGDLLLIRYENLILNSCIHPLVAIFDSQNSSELLQSKHAMSLVKQLIHEQVMILRANNKFLFSIPNATVALNENRLYDLVVYKLKFNPFPKMTKDISILNRTDVNYLNGYFSRLAQKKGINAALNDSLTKIVKSKVDLMRNRVLNYKYL
ncbi:LAFE_0H06062g1_1 [Lachancea fermentati]|uniref:LAFE_0H06062g1_1 n=1 Tax=Lachancea fermentati TaxID=4955 RepID=A0A1G4MJQ6_LACFM|nr:LAFE_0H06062g1_1 [Lachancea fermentati]